MLNNKLICFKESYKVYPLCGILGGNKDATLQSFEENAKKPGGCFEWTF